MGVFKLLKPIYCRVDSLWIHSKSIGLIDDAVLLTCLFQKRMWDKRLKI